MADEKNVNEPEYNEVNEASEIAEDGVGLSKHAMLKAIKSRQAQTRIRRKQNMKKAARHKPQGSTEKTDSKETENSVKTTESTSRKATYRLANNPQKLKEIENFQQINEGKKPDPGYKIEETTININENESIKSHIVNMPHFYRKWYKRLEDGEYTQSIRSGLYAIFRDAGFMTNQAVPFQLVDDTRNRVSKMYAISPDTDARNVSMHEMATQFFKDSYDAIERARLSPENRIITAQKIADLMLKTYSPMAFINGELNQYADNYVVNNKAVLKDQLEKLDVENIDKLMEDVKTAFAQSVEREKAKAEAVPEPEQNPIDNQENSVDPPKEEQVNEEPTKEEPTAQEPPKEEPKKQEPQKEASTPKTISNESTKPKIPEVSNFYDRLKERMDSNDVTVQVKSELNGIIKAVGITNDGKVDEVVEKSYSHVKDKIQFIYDPSITSRTKMSNDAPVFFYNAFESLEEAGLNTADQIIAAQKIANVMLKNYSPVAFMEEGLERYADDYVLNNREELEWQLDLLGLQNIGDLIEEVNAVRAGGPRKQQPKTENKEQEEAVVEPPKEEPQKEEPQKEEPPKEEPPKEEPPKQEPPKEELPKEEPPKEEPPKEEPPKEEPPKEELPKEEPPKQELPKQDPSKVGPEWINMPKFDDKLATLMKNKALPGNTKKYISDILKESGVETGGADDPLGYVDIINDAYDQEKFPRDVTHSMRDITKQVFISTYNALTKKGLNPKNKVEATQKISDVLLKFYSPATLVPPLEKYTKGYVSSDKELLKECLTSLKLPENEIKAIVGNNQEKKEEKPEQKPQTKEEKTEQKPEPKPEQKEENKEKKAVNMPLSRSNIAMFANKVKDFNAMYKTNLDAEQFGKDVSAAWELICNSDSAKSKEGKNQLANIFKDTVKKSFAIEKDAAYEEHRLPEYVEILKSSNELLRGAMYGYTDLYHNPNRAKLFDDTSFGGLDEKDMADLTAGDSLWSKDQKSDEAWEIQSAEAKSIAGKWLAEDKPYEKMVSELKTIVTSSKENIASKKEILDTLTAAEWLLVNNEKMMVEDPEDPLNPIPNWGNRYWKALTEAREALGIDKHTSMRDLIQGDYAASAKAVTSSTYNTTQFKDYICDPDARQVYDSMDIQREQFATLSAAVTLITLTNEKKELEQDTTEKRVHCPVPEEDQRLIMKSEPKTYNFVIDRKPEMSFTLGPGQTK